MAKPFKPKTRDGKPGRCYYGKYKERGRWVKVRLFTDKRASEMRLADLQRIAERREAGVVTARDGPRGHAHAAARRRLPCVTRPRRRQR